MKQIKWLTHLLCSAVSSLCIFRAGGCRSSNLELSKSTSKSCLLRVLGFPQKSQVTNPRAFRPGHHPTCIIPGRKIPSWCPSSQSFLRGQMDAIGFQPLLFTWPIYIERLDFLAVSLPSKREGTSCHHHPRGSVDRGVNRLANPGTRKWWK